MIKDAFLFALIALFIAVVVTTLKAFAREKARRRWLLGSRYAVTIKDIENLLHGNDWIIYTNFGGGPEIWYLPDADEAEDFKKGVYVNGKVLISENFKDVELLCKKYKIQSKHIGRKWNRTSPNKIL